ncbi:MAG: MFS transporter [Acidaminococcaceae bacterium]|jgi:MFS family permease|nr:MFS transporter [Acidaminococcaceae bacterium]
MLKENKLNDKSKTVKQTAFAFVVLMGIVSMCSDMTHESASSIMGAYLSLAGASAAAIGFVSGLGELMGYSLRLVTGIFTDKTKKYWTMTIIGYLIDCLAIPALALVPRGGWIWACALIVIQRTGKAIKKPAKDTILSFAATQTGAGKAFAIQEFLDQLGAFLGPVLLFVIMLMKRNEELFSVYSYCFALLGIPALATVLLLLFAKRKYPNPEQFEPATKGEVKPFRMNKTFIFYMIGISFFAAGFLDFPMITLHTLRSGLIPNETLPLLYAGAMAVDAFAALFFGNLFDKYGLNVLMLSTLLAAPFSIFVFMTSSRWTLFLGVTLWGIGMGAEESILKAAVTQIVPKENRSSGFGIFQTAFGICWFLGSWFMGILYDKSPFSLVIFSVVMQLAAIPFFGLSGRNLKK